MIGRDIYKIWAPLDMKWIEWVRPVPFVEMDNDINLYNLSEFTIPKIEYISEAIKNIAIIIDEYGDESIKEGIALAKIGFRPIPLFNGTSEQEGAIPTVDNHMVECGLIKGAEYLRDIKLEYDAPPVFLLDSNRTNRYKMNASVFDNSWDIYAQDLPTAEYFIKNGIDKIIVKGNIIQKDLKLILYQFQKKGIKIFFTNGYDKLKEVRIKKYNLFRK